MYFKSIANGEIRFFDDDVCVSDYLNLDDFIQLDNLEIDKFENQEKYLSVEEKRAQYLASFPPLTRRQFKLALLENNLMNQFENAINAIEDDNIRGRIQIEYTEAVKFYRRSDSVIYMCNLFNLTDDQVDQMWEQALIL